MAHPLDSFLSPKSIAIIGASPDNNIRGWMLQHLLIDPFPGDLYPINPRYEEIRGHRCYPSITAVGKPVDLVLIAIPSDQVLPVLKECAEAGAKNCIVMTSGFAEEGEAGAGVQQQMSDLAKRSGMRICGPNAIGILNAADKVNANFSPVARKTAEMPSETPRKVGVVGQSGGMSFAFMDYGRPAGLGFSIVVNTANEADLTASEVFHYLVDDPGTDVIILFLEGVRDPERFIAACKAAVKAQKPVIVCKIGRSQGAARAVASHTANMAGSDVAYDAVFRKYGFHITEDLEETTTLAAVLATCPPAMGNRVAIISGSGGGAALSSDALAKQGLDIPELSPAVQARIAAEIPAYGATSNPIDITAVGVQQRKHSACLDILEASDEVDMLFIVSSYAPENRISLEIDDLRAMMQRRNKPVILYTYTRPSRFCADQIASAGAYPNIHLNWAAKAAAALVEAGRFVPPAEVTPSFGAHAGIAAALPAAGALGEYDAKVLLEKAGIGKPTQRLVKARGALAKAAGELGYPLAMKIQSPDILHKTEVGGVTLNLKDEAGLSAAYDAMLASVDRKAPKARIDGVLLQPMAPAGLEILIGTLNDPTFGPIVSVGMGGVTAELFKDVAYRHAPIDAAGAKAMLAELTIHPLLEGYRGAAPTDIDALAQIVAEVSQLACAFKDTVREIELNPVLVHPKGEGCTIVDALILTGPAGAQP